MEKTLEIELTEIRPKVLATALKFFRASRLDGDPEDVVQDVLLRLWGPIIYLHLLPFILYSISIY